MRQGISCSTTDSSRCPGSARSSAVTGTLPSSEPSAELTKTFVSSSGAIAAAAHGLERVAGRGGAAQQDEVRAHQPARLVGVVARAARAPSRGG